MLIFIIKTLHIDDADSVHCSLVVSLCVPQCAICHLAMVNVLPLAVPCCWVESVKRNHGFLDVYPSGHGW